MIYYFNQAGYPTVFGNINILFTPLNVFVHIIIVKYICTKKYLLLFAKTALRIS